MSSNKFGYVGYQNNPEQSFYNNKGIFSVNEIYDLAQGNKWTNNQSYESVTAHDGGASELNNASASSYATFQVPKGYRATHVQVNGSSSSSTFDVYSCDITDNSATAQTSSPAVNTNQALTTAQAGEAGKYLSIKFTPGATRRTVLGAKITLERF